MEEVFLTADILIHFPFSQWMPDPNRNVEQAVQADKLFRRIIDEELIAYITDVTVYETVKRIEAIPWEPLPEPKRNPETGGISGRMGFATSKSRVMPLLYLIQYPNFVGIDKYQWQETFNYYMDHNVSIETAYTVTKAQALNQTLKEEDRALSGMVSFYREYDILLSEIHADFRLIDPSTYSKATDE